MTRSCRYNLVAVRQGFIADLVWWPVVQPQGDASDDCSLSSALHGIDDRLGSAHGRYHRSISVDRKRGTRI